jgi:hypothetical protein
VSERGGEGSNIKKIARKRIKFVISESRCGSRREGRGERSEGGRKGKERDYLIR